MAPRIAIIYYSLYGHIRELAYAEKKGVEAGGGIADLFQVPEILPMSVLKKFAPEVADPNVPIATPKDLCNYDAFIFGIPTRFGSFPSQWASFWARASSELENFGYWGKVAGVFTSCTSLQSGMEMTCSNCLPFFAQHGIMFMPMGAKIQFAIGDVDTVTGGSPYGAGTYCAGDHKRFPSQDEFDIAELQGYEMARAVQKS